MECYLIFPTYLLHLKHIAMSKIYLQIPSLNSIQWSQAKNWLDRIAMMTIDYIPKVVAALLIYLIGNWLIKWVSHMLIKVMQKKHIDPSLQTFLSSMVRVSMLVLLLLTVISVLGVNITSFAALLAGAGLAIGAALNGSLGNIAGGVMILIFKPFKVGDIIEAQGQAGVVKEIGIFSTVILTPDNKTVILPNGSLSTGVIVNFNAHGNLRVDLKISIDPSMDIDKARQIAIEAMSSHSKVLSTPVPEVSVLEITTGMVTLAIRPYTTQDDYWAVYFGVQELVKKAFDKHGILGPTPTRIIINK
jgi:small conductance mechanosensitive channel